jgi:hypothetical protein
MPGELFFSFPLARYMQAPSRLTCMISVYSLATLASILARARSSTLACVLLAEFCNLRFILSIAWDCVDRLCDSASVS